MRNKVTIGDQENMQPLGTLETGTMFRLESPTREDTVYMKTGDCQHPSYIYCIPRKCVYPMREGQRVTITQG